MTREEARNLLFNSKPKGNNAHSLILNEAIDMAIEALKQEPKYCDRNICIKNEYNGIGCDECEITKSQEPILDKYGAENEDRNDNNNN